ncbi:2-amino-4-hydroxy-6-hydroxymethyldihydropteridine diphosphokinase [Nesterenkonia jeotgali]|uniref:Bifunctional folate synthesis protein n=1 Tax=Nesterenkonia jeotgali TaxID=317018 RepID=A0A839FTJ1_9MICC|nr:2-amino-4-hydroxy-6-hydroxymethyldihydropteridine diphosphokinase [Nesterenkonia jeotgali]MBA8921901.1 dihydroneopterin aldolase/2-amino-4-hydroxy-6-hydroxymethyldihydropteridine diphosphokinase [Nesterenkonia jeotgali]
MSSRSRPRDSIRLTGLTATGHHGVFDFEKREGQTFRVDVELTVDFRAAGRSDDLADTVSYVEIAELVQAGITGAPFDLIEALAEHLARAILRSDERIAATEVTVHKPQAPLPQSFQDVSVTARRDRADLLADPAAELAPNLAAGQTSGQDPAGAPGPEVAAVLALGSNLGESAVTLASAVTALEGTQRVRVLKQSPVARTSPVGGPADQPDFLNQVIEIATTLSPQELLRRTQAIEAEHHRARGAENGEIRWGPRTLDIDIISYGQERISSETLQVPHPRAAQRGFVLVPWTWMDPQAHLAGRPVAELARDTADFDTVQPLEHAP